MAKNAKVETETINLGEFIDRLGISAPTWKNHPEYREFLEKQDGVVFEARKSFIPADLVDVVRDQFNIVAGAKRAPRGSRKASTSRNRGVDYGSLSVADLLEHKANEEALLADGADYAEQIRSAEAALADLRSKQDAVKGAHNRLDSIRQALSDRTAALEAESDRIAQEKALLESLNA